MQRINLSIFFLIIQRSGPLPMVRNPCITVYHNLLKWYATCSIPRKPEADLPLGTVGHDFIGGFSMYVLASNFSPSSAE